MKKAEIYVSGPVKNDVVCQNKFDNVVAKIERWHHACLNDPDGSVDCRQCPMHQQSYIFGCLFHKEFPDSVSIMTPMDLKRKTGCSFERLVSVFTAKHFLFLNGWKEDRCSRMEHRIARFLGKDLIYQNEEDRYDD